MTTAVVSPHTADLPIVVQDRRRRGFYTIDNEIIDRYGMVLKAHGVAVDIISFSRVMVTIPT